MADRLDVRVNLVHKVDDGELRAEMARQRKSQAALAVDLGITQQSLSRKFSGGAPFTGAELTKIAELLGVDVSQFMRDDAA